MGEQSPANHWARPHAADSFLSRQIVPRDAREVQEGQVGLLCFGGLKLCSCFLGSSEKGMLGISWASHDHLLRKAGRGCVDPIISAPDFLPSLRDAAESSGKTGHLNRALQPFS